mmetsp:Transcript_19654/g.75413  ORF Transcript_19654/g.75413 Transcript_19654/m.75413 type:complete len:213 (+) Transcript_19654:22-660(+)
MAETTKPVLYSYWRSSCSWRVRIGLALKGVEYDYRAVHLLKDGGEQLQEEFAKLNPMKLLPAFVEGGLVLSESLAILEYLEETRPSPALLPPSAAERAQVRRLCQLIACDIQPLQNLKVLKAVGAEKKMEWGKRWIKEGFEALEPLLAQSAGQYSFGDQVTLADLCLVPQVYNANRFAVDMAAFPTISRVAAACAELPAFAEAHPDRMPDAQ